MSWTYNVNSDVGIGSADGSMTIIGSGILYQSRVNNAINNYNQTPGQTVPLTSVVVAGSFGTVDESGFYATGFTSIVFSADSQVTSFGSYMFYGCTKLANLVLPPKIRNIPLSTCYQCRSLKTVVIPESVVSFERYAFQECDELEHMVIPSIVSSYGDQVFAFCPKLVSIEFLNPSTTNVVANTFRSTNNIRFMRLAESTWSNYIQPSNTSLRPILEFLGQPGYKTWDGSSLLTGNGMTVEDNGTFSGNYNGTLTINRVGSLSRSYIDTYLNKSTRFLDLVVTLGSGVTALETDVFSGMTGLTEVKIPVDNVITTINSGSFQGCTALNNFVVPSGVTTVGDNVFQDCTSLQDIVFPQSLLTIGGTAILAGATAVRTLKMHEALWENMSSLVENKDYAQLVQFYGDTGIIQPLETQLASWDGLEGTGGTNAKGYKNVIDYYTTSGITYNVDWSGGTTATLVKGTLGGSEFDVSTGTLNGLGIYDGALTIVGTGELTQTMVDAAISAHTVAQNGVMPLRTLTVGPMFTSLDASLSLEGTGITKLSFPGESPITTTGSFGLAIDSTLAKSVVLPRWVVQQGPWSFV
jgi:hypothetical protein